MNNITLEEFRATRREVPNLREALEGKTIFDLPPTPAVLYLGHHYIDKVRVFVVQWDTAVTLYFLELESMDILTSDLEMLEVKLYNWLAADGWLDRDKYPSLIQELAGVK